MEFLRTRGEVVFRREAEYHGKLHAESTFTVQLSDYDIKVPKVVHQKIAEVIDVRVILDMTTR